MLKIQIPQFTQRNEGLINHAFLTNILKKDCSEWKIKNYFSIKKLAIFKKQIHSNLCYFLKDNFSFLEGDAIVTKNKEFALCIKAADCVPILLADCKNEVIGAIHAGWRGAKNNIIEKTINTMKENGANIANIDVAIGPAINQKSYEVKEDFYNNFIQDSMNNKNFFNTKTGIFFDLVAYVMDRLISCGIKNDNIFNCKIDTYSNVNIASHRRCIKNNILNNNSNLALISFSNNEDQIDNLEDYLNFNTIKKTNNKKIVIQNREFNKDNDLTDSIQYEYNKLDQYNSSIPNYLAEYDSKKLIKKINNGSILIEDKIDLHGLILDEAYTKVKEFILQNYLNNKRYLLIIVGKGKNNSGLIKNNIRSWLEGDDEIIGKIFLFQEALQKHGGAGSFYIFLRKKNRDF